MRSLEVDLLEYSLDDVLPDGSLEEARREGSREDDLLEGSLDEFLAPDFLSLDDEREPLRLTDEDRVASEERSLEEERLPRRDGSLDEDRDEGISDRWRDLAELRADRTLESSSELPFK